MPALAITTSMPPKRSTVPSTARSSASQSVTSHSKRRGVRAALGRHPLQLLRLEAHERHVGARGGGRRADSAPMPRAAPVIRTVLPRRSELMAEP